MGTHFQTRLRSPQEDSTRCVPVRPLIYAKSRTQFVCVCLRLLREHAREIFPSFGFRWIRKDHIGWAATLWCLHLNRTNCHNLAGKANISVIIWINEIRNSPQIIKVSNLNSDLAAGIL